MSVLEALCSWRYAKTRPTAADWWLTAKRPRPFWFRASRSLKADLEKGALDAIAEVSQQANGALRIKMHDKHAALVSLGKHLGLFTHSVQIKAVYGIRDKPMTAEEWKKQFVKPG